MRVALALMLAAVAGCTSSPPATTMPDASGPVDVGPHDAGPCSSNAECPGSYCNAGSHHCCVPADPPYEICGDRIDQDCDMHDESCGDQDQDGYQACMPGESPTSGTCDCNDEPARTVMGIVSASGGDQHPHAPEQCDGIDHDCDGHANDIPSCCPACANVPNAGTRADACTADGQCDCAGEPGIGPCAMGLSCCASGCSDTTSDIANCGLCNAHCTVGADRCTASTCSCGSGPVCAFTGMCMAGACH